MQMFVIKIRLTFGPKVHIDDKSALIQVMAWRRTGDNPFSEPMMTKFIDVYHLPSTSSLENTPPPPPPQECVICH